MEDLNQQPLTRVLLSDSVYQYLYRGILTGKFKPGERLREMELAERFNTSQAPIREALRKLEQEDLVQSIPFKGSFVTSLSEEEISDIYTVRSSLESLVIQRAVLNITAENEKELAGIIERMYVAAEKKDIAELTINDGLFHDKICEISGSHVLQQLLFLIGGKARLAIATADRFYQHNLKEIVDIHRPILEGLQNRDVEMAIASNNAHLKLVLERIGEELVTEIFQSKNKMTE